MDSLKGLKGLAQVGQPCFWYVLENGCKKKKYKTLPLLLLLDIAL